MTFSKSVIPGLLALALVLELSGCAAANKSIAARRGFNREQSMQGFYEVEPMDVGESFSGEASYYGPGFHGKKTANGETYDQNAMTCAHKTLPFGTKLKVTLLSTGKSAIVRVTDRGPYMDGRILDLSVSAGKQVGLDLVGVGEVEAEVVE
jgi:rare lipoprotein A